MVTPLLIAPLFILGSKAIVAFSELVDDNSEHNRRGHASAFACYGIAAAGLVWAVVRINNG